MIVCCPECGTSIWCADPQRGPSVIHDPCKFCHGRGYQEEHYPDDSSTCPQPYRLSYTCTYCGGSGKGDIKGIIE